MAEKQASVYIVDVGSSMGLKRNGRDETDLEFAMKWVWDKITSTVMTERKTDTVGVLGLRTDGQWFDRFPLISLPAAWWFEQTVPGGEF